MARQNTRRAETNDSGGGNDSGFVAKTKKTGNRRERETLEPAPRRGRSRPREAQGKRKRNCTGASG